MVAALQLLSIVLSAIGMALALAHALELPGKRRLDEEAYVATQTIYYPGFTVGGVFGEPLAMLAILALAAFMPRGTPAFWLTVAALVSLLVEHGIYWLVTHPVNKTWLQQQELKGAGAAFFSAGSNAPSMSMQSWTALRDRWEYSHLARAVFAALGFVLLVLTLLRPA